MATRTRRRTVKTRKGPKRPRPKARTAKRKRPRRITRTRRDVARRALPERGEPGAPSFDLLWDSFSGYQRTAALKAAIDLDVFTAIAAGATTLDALAGRCH